MKTSFISVLVIICTIPILTNNAQERIKARDKYLWDNFDTTSTVTKDSMHLSDLSGNWISTEFITYGDYEIGGRSQEGQVGTLEIKGDKWRNTLSGDFHTFLIYQNMIILNKDNCSDTAYINRITDKELMISYKNGEDFVQYHYRK
jgi:hypothetical protein